MPGKNKNWLLAAAVGMLATLFLCSHRDTVMAWTFQARDFERAWQVVHGTLIFWGPEATGGGHLPGGLYYFLLAIPLGLGLGWKGAWYLTAAFGGAGCAILFGWLRGFAGTAAGLVAVFWFLRIPIFKHFLNSSLSPFFVAAGLAAVCWAFLAESPRARGRAWWAAALVAGLGIQLHFSVIQVVIIGSFVQALSPRLGLPRLPAKTFAAGFAGLLALLLPFFLGLGAPVPATSGPGSDALPVIVAFGFGGWGELPASELLGKIFYLFPLPLLAAGLLFFVFGTAGEIPPRTRGLAKILAVGATVSFLPAAYFFVRAIGVRYTVPFDVCIAGLCAIAHLSAVSDPRLRKYYAGFCAAVLAALLWFMGSELNWVTALFTAAPALAGLLFLARAPREQWLPYLAAGLVVCFQTSAVVSRKGIPRINVPQTGQVAELAQMIRAHTGWDYAEARRRIFFVNGQMELSLRFIFDESPAGRADDVPDGFFVATNFPKNRPFGKWLMAQPVQTDIKRALREGALKLGTPLLGDTNAVAVPYWITDKLHYPASFQNLGHPYESNPENAVLDGVRGAGAKRLGANSVLFHWSDCASPWCATGAIVGYEISKGELRAKIRVIGAPLEQTSEWTGPGWGQAWVGPYLEARCGENSARQVLIGSVGINPGFGIMVTGMFESYNSLLAPMDFEVHLPCGGGPVTLAMGREATYLHRMTSVETLHPPEAEIKIEDK